MKRTPAATFKVNGASVRSALKTDRTLLQLIREDLSLAGTSEGCGGGDCGACAMLVDGKRTLACITSAEFAKRKSVTTIEGIAANETLRAVHDAIIDDRAFPCGVCGPGMVLSVIAYLEEQPDLNNAALSARMKTNTCNCCGNPRIHAAIGRAADAYRSARPQHGGSQVPVH
jgi:aerobic-type carbon monoxide dehydrogenase small subunit (CoxS/CutS family)